MSKTGTVVILMFSIGCSRPEELPEEESTQSITCSGVKAFPTAEGFGAKSVGGRGGRVIEVTNLNDAGPGSLRACTGATGPRTCVFRVGGTIELTKALGIHEANSFVTVAGQTAPGGIQLKGGSLAVSYGAHDVIIRHIRSRPGPTPLGVDTNALLTYGASPTHVYNVIWDHCSGEWSNDENGTIFGWVTDTTYQWCIFAEGIGEAGHSAGKTYHQFGMLVGARWFGGDKITLSVHHSLFAHQKARNPLIARSEVVDFRNNIVYNWGGGSSTFQGDSAASIGGSGNPGEIRALVNFVKNLYLKGPNSTGNSIGYLSGAIDGTKVYTTDNWGPSCPTGCANDWDNRWWDSDRYPPKVLALEATYRRSTPFTAPAVTTHSPGELRSIILPKVGAYLPRDTVDTRVVNDVMKGTGRIAKIFSEVGPYPTLGGVAPPSDADHDGMPDAWESSHGLNPNNASDGATTASNGYTNLENYLNHLAGDPVCGTVPPPPVDGGIRPSDAGGPRMDAGVLPVDGGTPVDGGMPVG